MSHMDDKTTGYAAEKVESHTMGQDSATNNAINNEQKMSVRQSLRFWWKAVVFSFVISLAVVMEGYDTSLMNKFFAFEPFRNRFGDQVNPDGGMLVSARWQTIILNGTQASKDASPWHLSTALTETRSDAFLV
jgi:SP family general alpha glucoside:H+ symporter-like MFS transporter